MFPENQSTPCAAKFGHHSVGPKPMASSCAADDQSLEVPLASSTIFHSWLGRSPQSSHPLSTEQTTHAFCNPLHHRSSHALLQPALPATQKPRHQHSHRKHGKRAMFLRSASTQHWASGHSESHAKASHAGCTVPWSSRSLKKNSLHPKTNKSTTVEASKKLKRAAARAFEAHKKFALIIKAVLRII